MTIRPDQYDRTLRSDPERGDDKEKPDARPSVLAALEEKADKVEPVRPFKSSIFRIRCTSPQVCIRK